MHSFEIKIVAQLFVIYLNHFVITYDRGNMRHTKMNHTSHIYLHGLVKVRGGRLIYAYTTKMNEIIVSLPCKYNQDEST